MKSVSLRMLVLLFIVCLLGNGCGEDNYNKDPSALSASQECEANLNTSSENEHWERVELTPVGKIRYTELLTQEETTKNSVVDDRTGLSDSVLLSFTLVREIDSSITADGEIGLNGNISFDGKGKRYIFIDSPAVFTGNDNNEDQTNAEDKTHLKISGSGKEAENGQTTFKITISIKDEISDISHLCDIIIIDNILHIKASFTAEIYRTGGTGSPIAFSDSNS